ncbi:low molecular weight phosphatase family protein [Paludibaculum fermentans]|uniref:Uncharacterized protein n=1 Tax=Paludibaculum fermentans TaxID=1473598 RepID=A0A7S7NW71_PALFE|nr:hypothetical protein [Paludibaculum fermentans]QOY90912.1 hypothetical protein IRI77_13485 [Paludibaculum fermentans]
MRAFPLAAAWLISAAAITAQPVPDRHAAARFLGRPVTITEPALDADGFFPKGPASLCLEGPPRRQCYKAEEEFGRFPRAEIVEISRGTSALLFSVASGGVSGWRVHFALLRPGPDETLEDLFLSDTTVSNQSEHKFIRQPGISASPIFVTADYVLGMDEGHYGEHRYIISAYLWRRSLEHNGSFYTLADRFMTVRKYESIDQPDVIERERREILARLRRVVGARSPRPKPRPPVAR